MRPPRSCHQQEGGERMDGRAAAVGLKQRHLAVTGSKREAGERRREAVRTPRGLPPHRPLAELKAAAPSALPAATAPTAADLGREALLVPASEIPAVEDAAPTVARDGLSHIRPARGPATTPPPLMRARLRTSRWSRGRREEGAAGAVEEAGVGGERAPGEGDRASAG